MCIKTPPRERRRGKPTGIGWHLAETLDRSGGASSSSFSHSPALAAPTAPPSCPRQSLGPGREGTVDRTRGLSCASVRARARFDLERALYGLCHWHGPRTGRPHGWVPTCCCPETRSWNSRAARWKVFEPDGKLFFVLRAFPSRLPLA